MHLKLSKWGTVSAQCPNLATCLEFVSSWTSATGDIAVLTRICAGAIGAVAKSRLPAYRPSVHKPSEYGHICLDRLLSAGMTLSSILKVGTKVLQYLAEQIPKEDEVEEEADFFLEAELDNSKD
tara:strand:- start:672 stop:1043 length:372 start_codon:yes stop_codon:yes gene_type:complete